MELDMELSVSLIACVWPMQMRQMMERAGNSHLLSVASYPMTGHLIEPPYSPHIRASNFMVAQSRTKGKAFPTHYNPVNKKLGCCLYCK